MPYENVAFVVKNKILNPSHMFHTCFKDALCTSWICASFLQHTNTKPSVNSWLTTFAKCLMATFITETDNKNLPMEYVSVKNVSFYIY